MKTKIDFDCASIIASYIDVADIDTLIAALEIIGNSNIKHDTIRANRLSPRTIFGKVTDNVDDLMYKMRISGVLLSGSRGVDFLYPGACTDKSDYDFFCAHHPCDINTPENKVLQHFLDQGMTMIQCTNTNDPDIDDSECNNIYRRICVGTIVRRQKTYRLEFIYQDVPGVLNGILDFHSTASQCFVSGFGAVSMHHKLSKDRKMISWEDNDIELIDYDSDICKVSTNKSVSKYISRGYTPVRSSDEEYRSRRIGDRDCYVLLFKHSTKLRDDEATLDDYISKILCTFWYECNCYTISVANAREVYIGWHVHRYNLNT